LIMDVGQRVVEACETVMGAHAQGRRLIEKAHSVDETLQASTNVLAAAALDWTAERGVDRVEVRVASGNAEGQAFWRGLGFDDLMDVLQRRL
jgi:hypothetical protein